MQNLLSYLTNPFAADATHRRPPVAQTIRPLYGAVDGPDGWLVDNQVEEILKSLCALNPPDAHGYREKLSAQRFAHVSALVQCLDKRHGRHGREKWQLRPRLYTILRSIDALHLMDKFIKSDINDISLPFDMNTLPSFVTPTALRNHFLDNQRCVLTEARLLEMTSENGHSEHLHFETSADEHIIHYRLLGHGGYGSVDAVWSRLSLQFYARKRTHRGKDSESNRRVQRFLVQEINLMKRFSHRHLTRVVGSYTDPKYIGYLMQPIADCNLEDFLLTRRPTEMSGYKTLRQFFGCLAGAVNYLHRNRIRHRDLKLQNVLVKDSQVYIADFGAAMEWSSSRRATTQDRNAPKTLFYMAPEIDDRAPRNAASDMWSLGVVFLEMLTVLKGVPLKKWRDHLTHKARIAKRDEIPCRNIPALNDWLHSLQFSGFAPELDGEPLVWTKSLLTAKPEHRPSAQTLTKNIVDSPYFTEHCCFDCREDYEDASYFYEQRQRTEATQQTQELLDGELAALIGAENNPSSINQQRSQSIQDWIANTQTQIPLFDIEESHTTIQVHDIDMPRTRVPLSDIEELSISIQHDQNEAQVDGDYTKVKDPEILIPGAFDEKSPAKRSLHELGFVVEDDSESSGSSEYNTVPGSVPGSDRQRSDEEDFDGELFRIINDGDSENDSHISTEIPVNTSPLPSDTLYLENIPEDDREDEDSMTSSGVQVQRYPFDAATEAHGPSFENHEVLPDNNPSSTLASAADAQPLTESLLFPPSETPEVSNDSSSSHQKPALPLDTPIVTDHDITIHQGPLPSKTNQKTSNAPASHPESSPLVLMPPKQPRNKKSRPPSAPKPFGKDVITLHPNHEPSPPIPPPQIPIRALPASVAPRKDANTLDSNHKPSPPKLPPQTLAQPLPALSTLNNLNRPPQPDRAPGTIASPGEDWQSYQPSLFQIPTNPGPSLPQKKSEKPAKTKKAERSTPSALSSKNLEKLNSSNGKASPRRSRILEGETFSPVKYIEDAWHEMEGAESVATSVVSESVMQKFRGVHVKSLDRSYDWLEHYCQSGKAGPVRALLEQGCNPGTRLKPRPKPLLLAIKGASAQHNKCVRALIANGCDINARFRSKTPIHWAFERPVFNGHAKLIGMLLGAGAEMNQTDGDGEYPLLKVFAGNANEPMPRHRAIALALALHPKVPAPVDVNVQQPVSLNTALHLAVQRRAAQVVAILIHHGADVNLKNSSGTTPLLMAANQWRGLLTVGKPTLPSDLEKMLVYLLDAPGIDVNVQGGSLKRSALHLAAAAGYAGGVELLLAHGANRLLKDKNKKNALEVLVDSKTSMAAEAFREMHMLLSAAR